MSNQKWLKFRSGKLIKLLCRQKNYWKVQNENTTVPGCFLFSSVSIHLIWSCCGLRWRVMWQYVLVVSRVSLVFSKWSELWHGDDGEAWPPNQNETAWHKCIEKRPPPKPHWNRSYKMCFDSCFQKLSSCESHKFENHLCLPDPWSRWTCTWSLAKGRDLPCDRRQLGQKVQRTRRPHGANYFWKLFLLVSNFMYRGGATKAATRDVFKTAHLPFWIYTLKGFCFKHRLCCGLSSTEDEEFLSLKGFCFQFLWSMHDQDFACCLGSTKGKERGRVSASKIFSTIWDNSYMAYLVDQFLSGSLSPRLVKSESKLTTSTPRPKKQDTVSCAVQWATPFSGPWNEIPKKNCSGPLKLSFDKAPSQGPIFFVDQPLETLERFKKSLLNKTKEESPMLNCDSAARQAPGKFNCLPSRVCYVCSELGIPKIKIYNSSKPEKLCFPLNGFSLLELGMCKNNCSGSESLFFLQLISCSLPLVANSWKTPGGWPR